MNDKNKNTEYGFIGNPYNLNKNKRKESFLFSLNTGINYCQNNDIHLYGININNRDIFNNTINDALDFPYNNDIRMVFIIDRKYALGSIDDNVIKLTLELIKDLYSLCIKSYKNFDIIIRIGGAQGNKKNTLNRFCNNVKLLDSNIISHLSVMNDDKPSLFSIKDLISDVYYKTGIKLVVNTLYHFFNDGGLSLRESIYLSSSTWNSSLPIIIHSESNNYNIYGMPTTTKLSDNLTFRVPIFDLSLKVLIDSNNKDITLFKYLNEKNGLPPMIIGRINK